MELLIPFVVAFITQIAKRLGAKSTELGDYGLYLTTFVVGLIFAGFQFAWKFMPIAYAETATGIFAGAMVWYELLLKKIPAVRKLGGQE